MKSSDTIDKLSTAFVAAQAELKNAAFDKVNPHFKSKYATLAGIRDGIAPVLSRHGLAVIQGTACPASGPVVTTRLVHTSGQWLESEYPFSLDKPQQMGSALTYARRYCLAAICGIASEEDDDGNAAQSGETAMSKPPVLTAVGGTQGASKAANRDGYNALVKAIRDATSVSALTKWYQDNVTAIDKLPPDWVDELRIEYQDKQSDLKAQVAA